MFGKSHQLLDIIYLNHSNIYFSRDKVIAEYRPN